MRGLLLLAVIGVASSSLPHAAQVEHHSGEHGAGEHMDAREHDSDLEGRHERHAHPVAPQARRLESRAKKPEKRRLRSTLMSGQLPTALQAQLAYFCQTSEEEKCVEVCVPQPHTAMLRASSNGCTL